MRKCLILVIAIVIALCISEFVVVGIIGYPRNLTGSRKFKISEDIGAYNVLAMRPPDYPIWSVEGGNKVVRLNNRGLPGPAISNRDGNKNIILLGDSFIEGYQFPGEIIAAGVLQRELSQNDSMLQVINLSSSAHDPYMLWHRLHFYERYYKPYKVVLVGESFENLRGYLSRWSNNVIDFRDDFNVTELAVGRVANLQWRIRSMFGYLNLVATLLTGESRAPEPSIKTITPGDASTDKEVIEFLQDALSAFKNKYGADFIFVSLMVDNPYADAIKDFCMVNNIAYYENLEIMRADNQIDGHGHFNRTGNRLLGEYLHDIICQENASFKRPSIMH